MYPPEEPTNLASVSGGIPCFNSDFSSQYLPRPYPKVKKLHFLPVRPSGLSFFTNFVESPVTMQVDFYTYENLTPVPGIVATIEALEENFFIEFSPTGISDYDTIIAVFSDGTNVLGFSSPFVKVPQSQDNVVEIEYRTPRGRLYNFPYAFDEESRYNKVHVFANLFGVEYPEELTVYKEVTTGRPRKLNSTLNRTINFETYYLDFPTHEAIAVIFHHDDVRINGRKYVSSESYNPNYLPEKDLTKGSVVLVDSEFSSKLLSC